MIGLQGVNPNQLPTLHPSWTYKHLPSHGVWSLDHFRKQMNNRGITDQEVIDTLATPDKTYPSKKDHRMHICKKIGDRELDIISENTMTMNNKPAVVLVTVMVH